MRQDTLPVLIIGAGFAGLLMGIRLKRQGIDFLILEKSEGLGGTWHDNTYPGAGCDVVSSLYSYSFAPNADWSRRFARQSEIKSYLEKCALDFGIHDRIRFGQDVECAKFMPDTDIWEVSLGDGSTYRAQSVVFAVGQLNRPSVPEIDGQARFAGEVFHSARWRHDCDLAGKRVAVIGSGASSIQFLPHVARQARQVTLFQRSPNWIIPKEDFAISEARKRRLKRFPGLMMLERLREYWALEATFPAFLQGSERGKRWEEQCKATIARTIADPVLRQALTPDYPAGCKRVLLSDDWFETLARDNVRVVTGPIASFDDHAVVGKDGERHDADVVIYATGFEARQMLAPIDVRGRDGIALQEAWRPHPKAYLGVTVPGFPNAFIMYGPNTNLGHGSIVFMLECQARYIEHAVRRLRRRGARSIEARKSSDIAYNSDLQSRLSRTVWAANCSNWYKGEDGVIVNNWGSGTLRYWWMLLRFRLGDYQIR